MQVPKPLKYLIFIVCALLFIYVAKCTIERSPRNFGEDEMLKRWKDSVLKQSEVIIKSQDDSIKKYKGDLLYYQQKIDEQQQMIAEYRDEYMDIQHNNDEKIIYLNRLSTDSLAMYYISKYGSKN